MAMPAQVLLVRTPEGISLQLATAGEQNKLQLNAGPSFLRNGTTSLTWKPNGTLLLGISAAGVTVYDSSAAKEVGHVVVDNPVAAYLSPNATYLLTLQRPSKEAGGAEKNLKLWDWRKGDVTLSLYQKGYSKDAWPALQITADESAALHMVTNCINVYNPRDAAAGVVRKLGVKGVAAFAVSPEKSDPVVAAFVPEGKGAPGYIGLWRLSGLSKEASKAPYARRSFFRATSAQLHWNAPGTALLAITASDTDASNQSYYGEQRLHFLDAAGQNECLVPLSKEGPIHDVAWSPSGAHFSVVAGFMPAKTALFNARRLSTLNLHPKNAETFSRCKEVDDLGTGPFNTVRWNAQGNFLAVAGFGNLPGDIGFHEVSEKGKATPLGAAKAENGVSCEWLPDGAHVLVATTAPRMRVDNGFRLLRYNGQLLKKVEMKILLEAAFIPALAGTFPPPKPEVVKGVSEKPKMASAAPIRASGYVPPHVRSSGGLFGGAVQRSLPPGAEPEAEKTAGAIKKPRKRGGKGKGAKGAAEEDEDGGSSAQNGSAANGKAATTAEAGLERATEGVAALGVQDGGADAAKRARALRKKLSQIEALKEKAAGGAQLDSEQRAKLASEADLRAELAGLGQGS